MTAAKLVSPEKSSKAVTKVFSGITVGFAFGVPVTSYLAEKISLEAGFLFGAVVSAIAFLGILAWLPSLPVTEKLSYGKQLGILRKPQLWLNILTVIFIFAAMFSVYSYFAEYLSQVTNMNGSWISVMLMAFGTIMIFGNFFIWRFVTQKCNKDRYHVSSTICTRVLIYLLSGFVFHPDDCYRIYLGCCAFWGTYCQSGMVNN